VSESKYPRVFESISIGSVQIDNRIYFSPHGTPLSAGIGSPSDAFAAYYEERALGGCGLLLQAVGTLYGRTGMQSPQLPSTVPSYAAVADAVHRHGAKLFAQVHYSAISPFKWGPLAPDKPNIGPSVYQRFDHYSVAREMRPYEIKMLVESFRRSAGHLASAGYDGFELHLTHGMMGEQFASRYWNRRTDNYGGDMRKRLQFVREMIEATREGSGGDLPVGIRFNCDEMLPGGWGIDEAKEILSILIDDERIIDFVDMDVAVEPHQFVLGMPSYLVGKHSNAGFVAAVRTAATAVPVLSALGRITTVQEAEDHLAAGTVDLVGMARGLIAEPELVRHAREGREGDSRECIACNACMGGMRTGSFGCAINPASARELQWGVREMSQASTKSKVVVVGGGPGGMEAARMAAERGHDVVLFEKERELGGQYRLWARLPGRDTFNLVAPWYERQLSKLGVDARMGVTAEASTVLAEKPDAVVIATGSRYETDGMSGFIPWPIDGYDQPWVYAPEDILEGGARPTGRVVVLDDEALNTGAGIAELLVGNGTEVELITRWQRPVEHLLGTLEFGMIIPRLKGAGVTFTPETYIKSIGDKKIVVFNVFTNEERTIDVDAVVLVTMRKPMNALEIELEGKVDQLFPIGDALAPRGHTEAIYEGHRFARHIGEPDAPRTFADDYFADISVDVFPRPAEALAKAPA
jgi:2,4-dienoyl-CoA reductase-like NADH-dependent reductase (Old Yellow Enzyme family)